MKNITKYASLAVITACCNIPLVFAQSTAVHSSETTTSSWMIGITGGVSIPSGNFTKTDFSNPNSGFAGVGGNVGLTATYMLDKHWGISALASSHMYSLKGLQVLADGFKESFALDSTTVDGKGSNYTLNILAGPSYSISLGKKLSIDNRLLIGLVNAHLAGNQVFFENKVASAFTQKTSAANTVGLQIGSGLRYAVSRHFGVGINVDYFYSKPDFEISYDNRNNNAGRWIKSYNQPITGINTNLSFVYYLTKS